MGRLIAPSIQLERYHHRLQLNHHTQCLCLQLTHTNNCPTEISTMQIKSRLESARHDKSIGIRTRLHCGPIHRSRIVASWKSSITTLYRNGECKFFYNSQKKSHSYQFHMNDMFALIRYQKRKVAIKLLATLRAGSVIIANPGYLLSCAF